MIWLDIKFKFTKHFQGIFWMLVIKTWLLVFEFFTKLFSAKYAWVFVFCFFPTFVGVIKEIIIIIHINLLISRYNWTNLYQSKMQGTDTQKELFPANIHLTNSVFSPSSASFYRQFFFVCFFCKWRSENIMNEQKSP